MAAACTSRHYSPSWLELVVLAVPGSGPGTRHGLQVCERYLELTEEVVTCDTILIVHLQLQFVVLRLHLHRDVRHEASTTRERET